jgi:hypothetical protein
VLTVRVPGGLDLLLRILPVSDELIRCQSDHTDYACSHCGVAILGGDGMDFSTRVSAAKHTWVPMITS